MRKIPAYAYFLGIAIIIGVLIFVSKRDVVSVSIMRVGDAAGSVEMQAKGQSDWKPIMAGQSINPGDTIRTGKNAEADITWSSGTHARLDPNTTLCVTDSRTDNARNLNSTVTKLSSGKAWFRLYKQADGTSRFNVETARAKVMVRGTVFSVEVKSDGSVVVENYEGKVSVQQGKQGAILKDTSSVVIDKNGVMQRSLFSTAQMKAWESNIAILGAFVSVTEPQDNSTVADPMAQVSGYSDPGNLVKVNDMTVPTDKDGKWTARVALSKGTNIITIYARDKEGRQRNLVRKITY